MAHIHEKIDFCADVNIVFNNKVLLRLHDKYGVWLTPGGHIELDEDPAQAAIREVKEEVGLDVELYDGYVLRVGSPNCLIPPRFMNRHRINDKHEHITLVYFGRSKTDRCILPKGPEAAPCRWFSEEELDDPKFNLNPHVKHYAKTALKELRAP